MLKLTKLQIKRGEWVVTENMNLELERGKIYSILGPNGAGKSSLLKTIFAEIPYQGEIRYGNQILDKKSISTWRERIGYMPQDTQVEASLTALEVILLGKMDALHLYISDELLASAIQIMQKLKIAHLAHKNIMYLSGGQRQMVMFAQVLLRDPDILLLDEPVSALDMHHQINLLEQVADCTQKKQLITLMVLHDLSLAAQFSDAIILLGEHNLQGFGEAKQVLKEEVLNRLYHIQTEILYDRNGLPVIRPMRQAKSINGSTGLT